MGKPTAALEAAAIAFVEDIMGGMPQCYFCARSAGNGTCEAYPDGIPLEILANEADHHDPYDGDGGLQFQPKGPAPEEPPEEKGGKGSGNWGHRGREGVRGGSQPGGGAAQRIHRYVNTKRQAAIANSPAAMAVDAQLKNAMREKRPDARPEDIEQAAQALHDVFQMGQHNWDTYAEKYGLTEDQKAPYYKAVGIIESDMIRLEQQVKDRATFTNPDTGKPEFLAYNDPVKEEAYQKLVGGSWEEAESMVASRFGVNIINTTGVEIPAETRHYNASVIYNAAADNPVLAATMQGGHFGGIEYRMPAGHDTAWASWDGSKVLIKGNGYADSRDWDMPPGIFIHEMGHAFETHAVNTGLTDVRTIARTFGMGKMVSSYSWKSDSEDFAEHFLTIVNGHPDHGYAQHSPQKTKIVTDLITEALK